MLPTSPPSAADPAGTSSDVTAPGCQGRSEGRGGAYAALAAIALIWWVWGNAVHVEWVINPQYHFGWALPLLTLYLLAKRWGDRPVPRPRPRWALLAPVFALGAGAALVVWRANPEWRMLGWGFGLCAAGLSWAILLAAGGWPWWRHFGFVALFPLCGTPWPSRQEGVLVQALAAFNAMGCVEALHWAGIEAIRQGNLIRLATGLLGVEEACSGIRSLQGAFMVALFLGELGRFRPSARVALGIIAFATAIVGNLLRTLFLSFAAARSGVETIDRWHDPAGLSILVGTVLVLLAVSARMERAAGGKRETRKPGAAGDAGAAVERAGADARWPTNRLSWVWGSISVALLAAGWWGSEAWYRAHERDLPASADWQFHPPEEKPGYKKLPISERVAVMLRYDDGFSAEWRDEAGGRWQMFYFRWHAGRTALQLVKSHDPTVCLPGAGMRLLEERPVTWIGPQGQALPFRRFLFQAGDRPVHVFHCVVEDQPVNDRWSPADNTVRSRLRAVREGRRNRGQRLLEFAAWGAASFEEAEAHLHELIAGRLGGGEKQKS
jgi:exosortase